MFRRNYPYYRHRKLKNLSELLDFCVKEYPNKIAFSFYEGSDLIRKTFADFNEDVRYLSNFFYKNYRHKNIAICGENSYDWIVNFVAIVLSGNICVPIDKDCDESLLKDLLKIGNSDTLIYSEKYLTFTDKIKVKKLTIEDTRRKIKLGKKYSNNHKPVQDAPAVIFFTSGTTGTNKGVVLSEKNLTANIYGASSLYKPAGATVSILWTSHCYSNAIILRLRNLHLQQPQTFHRRYETCTPRNNLPRTSFCRSVLPPNLEKSPRRAQGKNS